MDTFLLYLDVWKHDLLLVKLNYLLEQLPGHKCQNDKSDYVQFWIRIYLVRCILLSKQVKFSIIITDLKEVGILSLNPFFALDIFICSFPKCIQHTTRGQSNFPWSKLCCCYIFIVLKFWWQNSITAHIHANCDQGLVTR